MESFLSVDASEQLVVFPEVFPDSESMGQHSVGCVDLMHRDLIVRLFYPRIISGDSVDEDESMMSRWLPDIEYAVRYREAVRIIYKLQPGSSSIPSLKTLLTSKTRSVYGAPLKSSSLQTRRYPVAVLSHSLSGNRCMYSATSIGLASHGYVVANVEHRDESASTSLRRVPGPTNGAREGQFDKYVNDWIPFNKNCGVGRFEKNVVLRRKQVKIRRKDVSEALDLLQSLNNGSPVDNMTVERFDYTQFIDQLDIHQCFVIGHSFGGATAIHTLHEDKRFRCGIALDPNMIPVHDEVYNEGFDQPLLFVNSDLGYQWRDNLTNITRLLEMPSNSKGIMNTRTPVVTLKGTTHSSYIDVGHMTTPTSRSKINLSHKLVVDLSCTFLNKFLIKDTAEHQMDDHFTDLLVKEGVIVGLQWKSAL